MHWNGSVNKRTDHHFEINCPAEVGSISQAHKVTETLKAKLNDQHQRVRTGMSVFHWGGS